MSQTRGSLFGRPIGISMAMTRSGPAWRKSGSTDGTKRKLTSSTFASESATTHPPLHPSTPCKFDALAIGEVVRIKTTMPTRRWAGVTCRGDLRQDRLRVHSETELRITLLRSERGYLPDP